MRNGRWIGLAVGCLVVSALAPFADVKPNALFSEGMVLQQGKPIPVWGAADDGEMVQVSLGDQRVSTVARDGKWMVTLNPVKAGGPYTMTIEGKNDLVFENVLVGEVWLGSGQSNMQWTVSNSNNAEQEIANADYPNIRLFSVPRIVAGKPQTDVNAKWEVCTPQSVPGFSAVLYFFGRDLHKNLNVPVGLIHTSWGGTPAESWTTRETLLGNEKMKGMAERWDKSIADFDNQLEDYAEKMIEWDKNADQAEAEGRPVPTPPEFPRDPRNQPWRPAGLYNAMIAPLIPYGI
nr:sialate O-acetylesterase [bacterium]